MTSKPLWRGTTASADATAPGRAGRAAILAPGCDGVRALTDSVKPPYDCLFMHGLLPRRVDPWRAGASASRFEGRIDAACVPRLAAVAVPCRPLDVRLEFAQPDGALRDAVQVAVRVCGRYALTCQRCLGPMELDLDVESQVLLAADEGVARRLEANCEVQVSPPGSALDLATLVEDEVMLALPFAPCHEAGGCAAHAVPAATNDEAPDGLDTHAQRARENPFAALAALKRPQRDE